MKGPCYHVPYLQVNTHHICLIYHLPHQLNDLEQMSCNPSISWNILCNQFISSTITKHQCCSMPLTSSLCTHKRNYQFTTNGHKWNPRNTSTLPWLKRKILQSQRQINLREPQFMGTLMTSLSQSNPLTSTKLPRCQMGHRWNASLWRGQQGLESQLSPGNCAESGEGKVAPAIPAGCPPKTPRQECASCKEHLWLLPIPQPPDPGSSS